MIAVYGPDWVMCRQGEHAAIVRVANDAAHSLESSGDVRALKGVMKRAEVFCKGDRMVCTIEHDNPKKDKLIKVYEKLGFQKKAELMTRRMPWAV